MLYSLDPLLILISKNSAMGKSWMSKINDLQLDSVSFGQKEESLAGGHGHIFQKRKQRHIEVK